MDSKPWLATYRENGIPAEIDADAYPSVVHMLDAAMTKFADKPAFRSFGQTLSYADVDRLSGAFAAWLQQTRHWGSQLLGRGTELVNMLWWGSPRAPLGEGGKTRCSRYRPRCP